MNFKQQYAIYRKSCKYADIFKNIIVYGFMLAMFLIFFFCVFDHISWIWGIIIIVALLLVCLFFGSLIASMFDRPFHKLFFKMLKR